ncbi:MAG: M50 family metallopeptidase [Spirochaetia bacterium]|nr:M50 family metallopeptidase [Spirochaetia bacterium]
MISRIIFLASSAVVMLIFWHNPLIMPLKIFVVYLHELSHAIGAMFTGGEVQFLVVDWDESGFTRTRGGNFLAITSSGYLGSILLGSIMLRTAIINRYEKVCAIIIGLVIIVFPLLIPQKLSQAVFILGVFWGLLFIISGLLSSLVTRILLFIMGGLTSLYSVFDLGDFFRGDIAKTDAGIIAGHYMKNDLSVFILSYLIGVLISVLSIWILYKIVYNALHVSTQQLMEENVHTEDTEEKLKQLELVSSLSPETIEMIVRLHQQKKD